MPALPDETAADADAILRANADDDVLIELNSLEGGEAVDETLGDLDNINLDDIDLGDDSGMQDPTAPGHRAPGRPVRPGIRKSHSGDPHNGCRGIRQQC